MFHNPSLPWSFVICAWIKCGNKVLDLNWIELTWIPHFRCVVVVVDDDDDDDENDDDDDDYGDGDGYDDDNNDNDRYSDDGNIDIMITMMIMVIM